MILNTLLSRDLLVDAYKFYCRRDARAHDALKIITQRDDMEAAVLGCLEQALKEEEPGKQQLYVQSACFGKKFQPGVAIEEYQATCKRLKVMNVLRNEDIDQNIEIEQAVKILVSWKKFDLALRIINYLGLDEGHIRAEWCEYLIGQHQLKDEQVAEKIVSILGRNSRVPYSNIATKAIERHRPRLAMRLIENENHSAEQIPLLLRLKQHDLALAQAIASCDSNYIYTTIFKLREEVPSEIPLLELLKKHRLAFKYYCNFLVVTDIQKLIMICHKDNSDEELIWCLLDNRVESALSVAKKVRRDIIPQQIEVSMRLNKFQQSIKGPAPTLTKQSTWLGLSISDTIINLIASNQIVKAKDAQKRFDVTDKKYRVLEQIAQNTLPKLELPERNQ